MKTQTYEECLIYVYSVFNLMYSRWTLKDKHKFKYIQPLFDKEMKHRMPLTFWWIYEGCKL